MCVYVCVCVHMYVCVCMPPSQLEVISMAAVVLSVGGECYGTDIINQMLPLIAIPQPLLSAGFGSS